MNTSEQNLEQALRPLFDWLARHFNGHRCLWLLALVCFLIAWNRGLALLYGLLALVLSVLLLSWLLPWWTVRSITMVRSQLGDAQVGKSLRLQYCAHAKRPRYHIIIREHLPCCSADEPQTFLLPSIGPQSNFEVSIPCHRRGVFKLNDILIGCAWPFGFVELMTRQNTTATELVVMPRTFTITRLPRPQAELAALDGRHQTASFNMQHEFAGIREYQFGDSLKHVHWSASARHQELIVREYDSFDRQHFLVVLDARPANDIGEAPYSSFEYAIMIAASMIEYAITQQLGLHLFVAAATPLELTVERGQRDSLEFLQRLAWLKADGETSYHEAVSLARQKYGELSTLVTIRNQSQLQSLPPLKCGHIDIVLQDQSFIYPLQPFAEGWRMRGSNTYQLLLHRNSSLEVLFNHD